MPSTNMLSEKEKEIIQFGKENSKSRDEIMGALNKYRAVKQGTLKMARPEAGSPEEATRRQELQQQAAEAEAEAQKAGGIGALAESLRQAGADIGGKIAKEAVTAVPRFIKSAVMAPIDIVRGLQGEGATKSDFLPTFQQRAEEQLEAHVQENIDKGLPADTDLGLAQAAALTRTIGEVSAAGATTLGIVKLLTGDITLTGKDAGKRTQGLPEQKIRKAVSHIQEKIKGKTTEQILKTPEGQVHKLGAKERDVYFREKQSQLEENLLKQKAAIKSNEASKLAQLKTEEEALNRQLQVASRDEVLRLRTQAGRVFGEQSKQYRALVEKELAPHKDVVVGHKELGKFIDARYSADDQLAESLKARLGLTTKATHDPKTTLGELYNQTKALGQDISSAAKGGGTRGFTPEDKLTDDAISVLTDFMKEKGVDLSAARQFWAKYAPIRNQFIREAKPFTQAGTQTKTFAQTLTRVAQGKDVNNENFISELEKLFGQKIGTQTRNTVAQLSQNAKAKIATEVEAELQKIALEATKQQGEKAISEAAATAAREARIAGIVKKVLAELGIVGAGIAGYKFLFE